MLQRCCANSLLQAMLPKNLLKSWSFNIYSLKTLILNFIYLFRSKTSIATFLVYCKQLATKSRKKAKSKRTLDQEPHICDLICLQFLCQVCPDDGFEFETLINLENESQSRRRNYQHPDPGYKYQKVVKQFKQLKNPETADSSTTTNATSNSEAVNVNSWQLLAFQNVPPKSQRYSESYGSDDSD